MSENTFIRKRQKARSKPFLTLRIIFGFILLSFLIWGGFYSEYSSVGDVNCEGACENLHSLGAWVLGFFIIFLIVIGAGAVFGGLFALLRWSRKRQEASAAPFMPQDNTQEEKSAD